MKMNTNLKEFLLFTVVPFLIPFILEINDGLMDVKVKWTIIILLAGIDFFYSFKTLLEKENMISNLYIQNSVRYAYSRAHEIIKNKRNLLSRRTEIGDIDMQTQIIPYDIHDHISDICKEFKNVISSITKINAEYLSVIFIYRYVYENCSDKDKQWKWIIGKEPTNRCPINDFVEKEDTTYYSIIYNDERYVFGNNKEELAQEGKYHLSKRDKMYNNVGSIFSILVAFGNNKDNFVEGIITVSTHGKYFIENIEIPNAEIILRNMIIDEIFPYYQKLLETELGLMYIRHINKSQLNGQRLVKTN